MVFDIVAVVSPAPGKAARVEELLKDLTSKVEQHEPEVEKYIAYKVVDPAGAPEFVVIERYRDVAGFTAHIKTDHLISTGTKMRQEGLLAKPLNVMKCSAIGGFDSRSPVRAKLA